VGVSSGRGGSDRILRLVALACEIAGTDPGALDVVAVSAGPGTLTGLRVGIGTARGLALGGGKRVIGVSTLQAMAARLGEGDPVLALLEAGRGEIYGALFSPGDPPRALGEERVGPPEAFAAAVRGRAIRLAGAAARRHAGLFGGAPVASPGEGEPFIAAGVARVAGALLRDGTAPAPFPRYLRRDAAPVSFGT
jgi:tRNA threonylcarbamoyladenosine biosynthesis protein TsaB